MARVVIRFDKAGSSVQVDDAVLRALGSAAQAATRIVLHGCTDSLTATPQTSELALERAVSVKKLLVAQGVSPERIRIFYRGAGDFVADNSTDAGKAINRRVEIQMTDGGAAGRGNQSSI
jgi:outer membrane protein OmpA-like peptidoglycan-associated protein